MAFSSPEKFRWEITFGQGAPQRGVITFKAGEPDSKSIPQSIDPDEHYQLKVYRVSDHNNDADDELVFQQQSEHLPLPLNNAPQQSRVGGDQEPPVTDITQVKASLVLNKDEVIIIDASALLYMHPTDPNAELTYTLTADPAGGDLFLGDVELGNGDTFTQSDIDAARLTFRFTADNNDPTDIAFTVSDGTLTLSDQTLTITPRVVVVVTNPGEDNTEDLSSKMAPQKIEAEGGNDTIAGGAGDDQIDGGPGDDTIDGGGGNDVIDGGDGNDTITGGAGDDQIDGGAGDDDITLTHAGETVGFSKNEVVYTFGYDGVGIDGGDVIKGFKLGQDKLKFIASPNSNITNLTEFLNSIKGADNTDLTDDDAFIVTMMWSLEANAFSFDGVLLHFKEGTSFGGGRLSSPVVQITFDEPLNLEGLVRILGGAGSVADNFDGGLAAFKNLADVLPRLFGEGSIDFKVLITGTVRGEVTEDDARAKTATGTLTAIDDGAPLTPTPIIELVGDGVGTYGMMTFDAATGEWTYTLDNTRPETQVLKADQQEAETFTFTAAGGIFTVTIMVNGADDKPVANTKFFEASGAVGREITIDPNTLFNDPDGEDLDLTFTVMLLADDSTREEISTIGLSYNPLTKMITGTPTKPGFYTLEVAASYSGGAKDDIVTTFGITVLSKFFGRIQFDALNGVEDIAFDERAEITLNDFSGPHQRRMEAIANAFKTDAIADPNLVHIIAREGGDDIIASPNNDFFSVLSSIHRVSDQSVKERAIEGLKSDLSGDIILVSAGNTGQLLDHAVLEEKWVHDLLDNEDVNLFFVIGITTNEDGEKEISPISSTLPISYSDNVIGASLEVPILIGGEVETLGGTSASAVLTAIFFARLQVLLPDATINELVEIGKWLLEPLEDTLGIISFEKFNEISLNFSKDIEDLLLEEILDYVRSNPRDDENPTLEEGSSGASPEDLLQSVEVIYDPPIIDDLPVIAEI